MVRMILRHDMRQIQTFFQHEHQGSLCWVMAPMRVSMCIHLVSGFIPILYYIIINHIHYAPFQTTHTPI